MDNVTFAVELLRKMHSLEFSDIVNYELLLQDETQKQTCELLFT